MYQGLAVRGRNLTVRPGGGGYVVGRCRPGWPDPVIVESTSGNMGVALAMLARERGYRFVAVVHPRVTDENLARLSRLVASIEMVDEPDETGGFLLARLGRVARLRAELPCVYWPDQYANTANPRAHQRWTGPEIWRQMDCRVGAIFVAVSTGGTLAGISRYVRTRDPQTIMAAVDVCGSVALGGTPGPRKLTGIGSSIRSTFLTSDLYDESLQVTHEQAIAFCRALDSVYTLAGRAERLWPLVLSTWRIIHCLTASSACALTAERTIETQSTTMAGCVATGC
jgi:cysteine synthase